ncbi:hypothetical protein ACNKHO_04020 [Shigella flexneri]
MHDLYARHNVKQLQKDVPQVPLPARHDDPQEANYPICAVRWNWFSCAMQKAVSRGRCAALPTGGAVRWCGGSWGGSMLRYFGAWKREWIAARFCLELQGVYGRGV